MRRILSYLLGLVLLAGYGGLLAFVDDASGRPPLTVTLKAGGGSSMSAEVRSTQPVSLEVDGQRQPRPDSVPSIHQPGLHTATWSASYMGKPPRSVSYSYVTGPYVQEGWVLSAARVAIGRSALDDGNPRKAGDLANALTVVIRRCLKGYAELRQYAGRVTNVRVSIQTNSRHVGVGLEAHFLDSNNRPSRLLAGLRLTPRIRRHKLRFVRTGPIDAKLDGAIRGNAQATGAGLGLLAVAVAAALLDGGVTLGTVLGAGAAGAVAGNAKIDHRLNTVKQFVVKSLIPQLNTTLARFLTSQVRLRLQHGHLKLQWRPSRLILSRSGMALLFDVKVDVESTKVPKASWGAPVVGAGLRSSTPSLLSNVRIDLSANLVNVMSHLLWRHGILEDVINQPSALGRLSTPEVRDLLAFNIRGVTLSLPPCISRWTSGAMGVNVGGAEVGLAPTEDDPRIPSRVTLHGSLTLKASVEDDGRALLLTVEPAPLLASCGSGVHSNPLRPCLSDFIGVANSMLAEEGAFRFQLSLGALVQSRSFGVGSSRLVARVRPVSIGVEGGEAPSVRADLQLRLSAR